eukprot:759699-Hanusia_phi.AAC.2
MLPDGYLNRFPPSSHLAPAVTCQCSATKFNGLGQKVQWPEVRTKGTLAAQAAAAMGQYPAGAAASRPAPGGRDRAGARAARRRAESLQLSTIRAGPAGHSELGSLRPYVATR